MEALRIRVSMSAIGSVIIIEKLSYTLELPTGLADTWNLTSVRKFTETNTANFKSAHEGAFTTAVPASVDNASRKLWSLL
jgi:hypothetical protein